MDRFIEQLTPKEWEEFCARMLRSHYTANNFWEVPDADQGDLGLEFFTIDGTLYQCYFPDKNADMPAHKRKIQTKIREDLRKLVSNESEITNLLDGVIDKVNRWVLLVPEMKSKDLITYCNKKRNDILKAPPGFIDVSDFQVKIETAASYPDGALFAKAIHAKTIHIPIVDVTDVERADWEEGNTEFYANVDRKSNKFMGARSDAFKPKVIKKYIQIEKYLDYLRENHPDLHVLVEDSARAQLEKIESESLFEDALDRRFVQSVVTGNEAAFKKHSMYMSDSNMQLLSFGYLSKWLAECYMDFENE